MVEGVCFCMLRLLFDAAKLSLMFVLLHLASLRPKILGDLGQGTELRAWCKVRDLESTVQSVCFEERRGPSLGVNLGMGF